MSDIIQKAIEAIDRQAESGDALQKSIAQYLIDNHMNSEKNAEAVTAEGKTLKQCAARITANAKKTASGGCAVVEDAVVWKWVREYYGITENAGLQSTAKAAETVDILDFM